MRVEPLVGAPLQGRFAEVGELPSFSTAERPEIGVARWVRDRLWVGDEETIQGQYPDGSEESRAFLVAVADLDGDGEEDCVYPPRISWGCAIGTPTELPEVLNPVTALLDLDGDNDLDIVTQARFAGMTEPPFRWIQQVGPRQFVRGVAPQAPCLRVQSFASENGRLVAVGWNCDDAMVPSERRPARIYFRWMGFAWTTEPAPVGYTPSSPMALVALDRGCYLVTEHPEHVEICNGARVEVHPGFAVQWSAGTMPMIPWGAVRLTLEGRQLIAIAHGIDAWGSEEHYQIGVRSSYVTVWERRGPGTWLLVPDTGLDRAGEWRWASARGTEIVVGGYGERSRRYSYVSP